MDSRGPLQEARARMLLAQNELEEYVRSNQSNRATFDFLFDTSQKASAEYAAMLRGYIDEKYAHLKEQAKNMGLPDPTQD